MSLNAKRILIETERSETIVLRLLEKGSTTAFCETCGTESQMLDLNSAVTYSGQSARTLMREIESGAIHSTETANGYLLICASSLCKVGSSSKSAIENETFTE